MPRTWDVGRGRNRKEARDVDVQEQVEVINLEADCLSAPGIMSNKKHREERVPHAKHPTRNCRLFSQKADHPAGLGTDRNIERRSHDGTH